jgi:2,3-bisphosphoglycerate-independent phosphoglycerate mutase
MAHTQPVVLVILDGFGHRTHRQYNAIVHADTPHLTRWLNHYPHALLHASGQAVGLPDTYVGNSEVGHLTIGAGRIMVQPVSIINDAITRKTLCTNTVLTHNLQTVASKHSKLHIMGLVSDAGVHGLLIQLCTYIEIAVRQPVEQVIVHAFLDGRDCAPQSGGRYLRTLQDMVDRYPAVSIGSIHGRFCAMDRDHNWDRVEQSYRVLTTSQPETFSNWQDLLDHYYIQGITDEFIPPTQLNSSAIITDGDGIVFTNYRPDRARELTACFTNRQMVPFTTQDLHLSCFITPVSYGKEYPTQILFERPTIKNTLKEVLADAGKTMVSIAETEKYAHVTYFFNGEKEEPVAHEAQILIPSIKTKQYVEYPCMSAPAITRAALNSLRDNAADFYLINYANADMVGHSGNMQATIKALECLDHELGILYQQAVIERGGTLIITADHGKAEQMFDQKTGQPHTGHTHNPVPFLVISSQMKLEGVKLPTQLCEIAPFILDYMGIKVPDEMKS